MSHSVDRLYLAMHTRDEAGAESSDEVRIFAGASELARVGAPPGRGKVALREIPLDGWTLEALMAERVFLGLTGVDRWGPRSVLLWARVVGKRDQRFVPVAQALAPFPRVWVTQDAAQGTDRWELATIPLYTSWYAVEETPSSTSIVVVIETEGRLSLAGLPGFLASRLQSVLAVRGIEYSQQAFADAAQAMAPNLRLPQARGAARSFGPIEITATKWFWGIESGFWLSEDNAIHASLDSVRSESPTWFHTTLVKRGQQEPAVEGEAYMSYHDNVHVPDGAWFSVANQSDAPWRAGRIWVFGFKADGRGLCHAFVDASNLPPCGQDPCAAGDVTRVLPSIYVPGSGPAI